LAIPFFDRIESRFPGEIEHEEQGHGVIADEGQHVHKLSLATEIPYRERYCRPPHRDGLFHEINAWDYEGEDEAGV
jgi:hypothetical protein